MRQEQSPDQQEPRRHRLGTILGSMAIQAGAAAEMLCMGFDTVILGGNVMQFAGQHDYMPMAIAAFATAVTAMRAWRDATHLAGSAYHHITGRFPPEQLLIYDTYLEGNSSGVFYECISMLAPMTRMVHN
jgi:hypothetical protein